MPPEEILVLHHSHLDVGYTHGQPIVGRLHVEFIHQALDLLDATDDWPEESAPKWTCEVTWPVLDWLEEADDGGVARFRKHHAAGRLDVCALPFGVTPLIGSGLLPELLLPLATLRERLGVRPRTALQHDVNGVPWPLADLLLDAGIEALFMGINAHCGGGPMPRPGVFLWETPGGRRLPVFNGLQYSMFDQFMRVDENDPEAFRAGVAGFLGLLEARGCALPFAWATASNAPRAFDNSPPNLELAPLVRQWNESGGRPRIRFATPTDLLERLAALPAGSIEVRRGDWTDYWNFGCGSTAVETALHKQACESLALADRLRGGGELPAGLQRMRAGAVSALLHYGEHTWGADRSVLADCAHVRTQLLLKQQHAGQAAEHSAFLLFDALETLAGNPVQTRGPVAGVLVVNPSPVACEGPVAIPDAWRIDCKRLRCERIGFGARFADSRDAPLFGPVKVGPGGSVTVPLADLQPYTPAAPVRDGVSPEPAWAERPATILNEERTEATGFIESPWHRLEYHAGNGRILSLTDLREDWNLLADHPGLGFFEYVRERPDARFDERRETFYRRDVEAERHLRSSWRPDWKAVHETPLRVTAHRVANNGGSATLIHRLDAPGVNFLEQRLTLHAHTPHIDLDVELVKPEIRTPEATYFALPLRLAAGWRGFFDTAGQTVELDREQLAGSSRGWVTCDRFAAICDADHGVALFTPDAPMVQFGAFNFGRDLHEIPRPADPLLLAWPLNNYWITNFAAAQPGRIRLRYALRSFATRDLDHLPAWAAGACSPLLVHPVVR
jgi:alpha-mannosidase